MSSVMSEWTVELSGDGYLRLSAALAERFFPHGVLVPLVKPGEWWLLPTRGAAAGGLLLKVRNPAGDRAVLIRELLEESGQPVRPGVLPAAWDDRAGALRVRLGDNA